MNIGNLIRCYSKTKVTMNIASMGSVNLGWLYILHTGNYKLPQLSTIYITTWYISGDATSPLREAVYCRPRIPSIYIYMFHLCVGTYAVHVMKITLFK